MRVLRKSGGFTLMELVVAMAIFAILGSTIAGLLKTGLSSYHSISRDMYNETEARTALSLISVQLRQHDITGAITVDTENKILRLKDNPSANSGTVIWFSDHKVYTAEVSDVNTSIADIENESAIATIYNLEVGQENLPNTAPSDTVTVHYGEHGEKTLSQTITQRSAPPKP